MSCIFLAKGMNAESNIQWLVLVAHCRYYSQGEVETKVRRCGLLLLGDHGEVQMQAHFNQSVYIEMSL